MLDSIDIFRHVAPEFQDISEEQLAFWIDLTCPLVSQKQFRESYPFALALLTAHNMKMAGLGETSAFGSIGDSLRVASYTEGGVSVSFSTGQQSSLAPDADLTTTPYGLQFLSLRRSHIIPIAITGV